MPDSSSSPPAVASPPGGAVQGQLHAWLAVAIPGLLLGVHLGGLLFFLNPHLPFEPLPVVRTCLIYGLLGGAVSALLSLPIARRGPRHAWRWVPWGLTLALAFAAVLDSTHASHYAYYLPSGINERLIKASLWLTLASMIAFYTALLHTLHGRRYGRRSRLAYVALFLVSIYVMVERREAFEPWPASTLPTGVGEAPRPHLLVVGVASANLDALLPLAEQGRAPFLDGVLEAGAYGHLRSLTPNRSAALWTTLATGKEPHRHGVLGGLSYPAPWIAPGAVLRLLPVGLGFETWGLFGAEALPADTGLDRRVRTLWEVLPLLGVETGVVGWPSTRATADLRGAETGADDTALPAFAVSDRFFDGRFALDEVRPPELLDRAQVFRVEEDDLDPRLTQQLGDRPPPWVLRSLARDSWRQSLASFLLEGRSTSLPSPTGPATEALFVELPGLAAVSEATFGGYSAQRLDGRSAPELQRSTDLLGAYYAALDEMIAELWAELPEPKILVLVSAHGVEVEPLWRRVWAGLLGTESVGGSISGSPDGVLVLYGAGVRSTLLTGARLSDVAPTLLYALRLPVARDFDGRILTEAFEPDFLDSTPLTFVPTYETLERSEDEPGGPVARRSAVSGPFGP